MVFGAHAAATKFIALYYSTASTDFCVDYVEKPAPPRGPWDAMRAAVAHEPPASIGWEEWQIRWDQVFGTELAANP